jgi:hypothetical protein
VVRNKNVGELKNLSDEKTKMYEFKSKFIIDNVREFKEFGYDMTCPVKYITRNLALH